MKSFMNIAALAASVSALAVPEKRASTTYTDTVCLDCLASHGPSTDLKQFDDLTTSTVVPQLFPIGLYHGLSYKGGVVLVRRHRHLPTHLVLTSCSAQFQASLIFSPTRRLSRPVQLVPSTFSSLDRSLLTPSTVRDL
jgi:hypothetical protein